MRIGRVPGLGAAAVLAVSTLSVFATFQNYGPESAVRRFHHAVLYGDNRELESVVSGPTTSTAVRDLVGVVQAFAPGANYRIVKSVRSPTQVEILALYEGPKTIVWVVSKARDRWRIDPYLTLQGLRKRIYQ